MQAESASGGGVVPTLLWVGVAVMLLEHVAWFVLHPLTLGVVTLVIVFALAWFLLKGSKAAWVLAGLFALGQVLSPFTMDQPAWVGVSGAVVLACLMVPSGRAYVGVGR